MQARKEKKKKKKKRIARQKQTRKINEEKYSNEA